MEQLKDLKAILHSKRANLFYLEKCRVMQKDGRVLYLSQQSDEYQYWNIPIANTTCILLGTGTSITQAAVRMLASAGVLIGFSGGGGTPLLMGTEIEWMTPQSEYRPTEYVQNWLNFWFHDNIRLVVAKKFQLSRIDFIEQTWQKDRQLISAGFNSEIPKLKQQLDECRDQIRDATNTSKLLNIEAKLTKWLYKFAVEVTNFGDFSRNRDSIDSANSFLNHGNYLAYGLAATTLWVLGIPHGFAVMHGKTRRGALVFDVADLIKDALVLPLAFICAKDGDSEQQFRQQCLNAFTDNKALDFMFNEVKAAAEIEY